jgi:hypothetical protein
MDKLLKWLKGNRARAVTMCMAGNQHFCRLQFGVRWDLPKDWPLDYGRFNPAEAIGYGSTYEDAIEEEFKQLPE